MPSPPAEPFCQPLISASRNLRIEESEITGRQITPQAPGWSVKKQVLHGGKQEGVDLVILNNGKLTITVVPTRGMSLFSGQFSGMRLGWDSPVREIVHPQYIHLQDRGGLGWLEGFNEWVVRCGLENVGPPGPDQLRDPTGAETAPQLTLHGRIANLPASEVELVVDRHPPFRLRLRGRVDERMFGGPSLELWTEISTEPDSNELRVSDTITNRGACEQEFQILYHANYGPPLLEAGATFLAPVTEATPRDESAARGLADYARCTGPAPGSGEQVFFLTPNADAQGRTLIALRNQACDQAVSMAFSTHELPCLTLWKNNSPDGYVIGLEPGTSFPNHRSTERQQGRVPRLAPGSSRHAAIDFAFHTGSDAVRRVAEGIQLIHGAGPRGINKAEQRECPPKTVG